MRSNLSHQFIQHQRYDRGHLNKSYPVKRIKDVCGAQMLWEAFSLKPFPLFENKDRSHLKQRAQTVSCCQHVFAILVLKWTTGISPYFYVRKKGCAMPIAVCHLNDSLHTVHTKINLEIIKLQIDYIFNLTSVSKCHINRLWFWPMSQSPQLNMQYLSIVNFTMENTTDVLLFRKK